MIRDFALADVITLGNGCAGVGSILCVLRYLVDGNGFFVWLGIGLLPLAGAFDYLDGRVARWRQRHTALGAQLDSLADLVSFGVAPAVLAFGLGLRGAWDAAILIFFVCCGLSRLARYNVTASVMSDNSGKVRYFEGMPIPTSILLVGMWASLFGLDRVNSQVPFGELSVLGMSFHPLVLSYLLSGSAMISKTLHIPKP
jgi:CDP-diacylglycerol---serine O-phosphatidyltransferase